MTDTPLGLDGRPVGVRRASPLGSIVAANTPITVYTRSEATKKVRIRKVMWQNGNAAPGQLTIGTGLVNPITAVIPRIDLLAGLGGLLTEAELPQVEVEANVTAEATIGAAAPNNIQVIIEAEEV